MERACTCIVRLAVQSHQRPPSRIQILRCGQRDRQQRVGRAEHVEAGRRRRGRWIIVGAGRADGGDGVDVHAAAWQTRSQSRLHRHAESRRGGRHGGDRGAVDGERRGRGRAGGSRVWNSVFYVFEAYLQPRGSSSTVLRRQTQGGAARADYGTVLYSRMYSMYA